MLVNMTERGKERLSTSIFRVFVLNKFILTGQKQIFLNVDFEIF
jgi:hypothetical protein